MKKKPTKRSKAKYPALDPLLNLKSRIDLIDYDYINNLDPEAKQWLNDFTEEYINANLNHKGKKLHKSKSQKKDCYDRNNARNRDVLTKLKASGRIEYIEDFPKLSYEDKETIDNNIVNSLDKFNKKD